MSSVTKHGGYSLWHLRWERPLRDDLTHRSQTTPVHLQEFSSWPMLEVLFKSNIYNRDISSTNLVWWILWKY